MACGKSFSLSQAAPWTKLLMARPRWLSALSGSRDAYSYLPDSIGKFPTAEQLAGRMQQTGFRTVEFTRMTGGTVALHIGGKSADAPLY